MSQNAAIKKALAAWLVLPAFGEFTGGWIVPQETGRRLVPGWRPRKVWRLQD